MIDTLSPDWDVPEGARQLTRDYGDPVARDRDIAAMGQQGWRVQTIATQPGQTDGRQLAIILVIGLIFTYIASQAAPLLGLIALILTIVVAVMRARGPARTLVLYVRDPS